MQLSASVETPALSHSESHAPLAMVSMVAPEAEAAERLPLEVVAVVDRSGSMSGAKMKTMKDTLMFLVQKGLMACDSFALVTFDDKVAVPLGMVKMGGGGKQLALDAVSALSPGATTNLSGGLLQGIDLLRSHAAPASGSTRAILLFTDGICNNGITEPSKILEAARGAMQGSATPSTLFTFGFGEDHQEDLLRSLAESTNGLYYFIETTESIPLAFADCLGGLVSVVAQNATLVLEAAPGAAAIGEVHGRYGVQADASRCRVEICIGDVYAEDEKDVLFALSLPPLGEARPEPTQCVAATLRYFSVAHSAVREEGVSISLCRPAETPAGQPLNVRLGEQAARVRAAKAMEEAARLADAGKLEEGRAWLAQWTAEASASPFAASPMVQNLQSEVAAISAGYASESCYRSSGSKMTKMSMLSHAQQRSNHVSGGVYAKKSKMAMRSMFAPTRE